MANQGYRLPKLKLTINELLYLITTFIEILWQYYNNMAIFIQFYKNPKLDFLLVPILKMRAPPFTFFCNGCGGVSIHRFLSTPLYPKFKECGEAKLVGRTNICKTEFLAPAKPWDAWEVPSKEALFITLCFQFFIYMTWKNAKKSLFR